MTQKKLLIFLIALSGIASILGFCQGNMGEGIWAGIAGIWQFNYGKAIGVF